MHVDAAELEVEEKALILLRHAQAARISYGAVALVREWATMIVEHEHFTPERIRRFVADRLPELSKGADVSTLAVRDAVAAEIREPTTAMAASLRALLAELRTLLVALLDAPAGPSRSES